MKLSEAIRLGSLLVPQCHGSLWDDEHRLSCALGAACDALGIKECDTAGAELHALNVEFPFLEAEAHCPACNVIAGKWRRFREKEYDTGDVIVHLNDDHKWSRRRIADWVQTIEPAEQETLAPEQEKVAQEQFVAAGAPR